MLHLVILNPRAGRGRKGRTRAALEAAFARAGLEAVIRETEGPDHAVHLAAESHADFGAVIVAGGDGTLHEVLQGMDLPRQRLGVVPWGSGNDFAWLHGWPADVDTCARRIAAGAERKVDLGVWEGERTSGEAVGARFHNSVGLGFEATVNEASHRPTPLRGPLLYVAALLRSLPRYRNYPVRIRWDGGSFEGPVTLLAAANGKRVGGCFLLAPDADPADGLLDLVRSDALSLPRALWLLSKLFTGAHVRSPRVHLDTSREFRIEAMEPIPVYVDGEFAGEAFRTISLRIEPGALRIF